MEVSVEISGRLNIEPDDFKRIQNEGPQDLMRALLLNNAKITTRVTEVYKKTEKDKV